MNEYLTTLFTLILIILIIILILLHLLDFEWVGKAPNLLKPVLAGAERREPVFISNDIKHEKSHYFIPEHYDDTLDYLLIPHGQIVDRVEKLAWDMMSDYSGETVHLLCVLKGASTFFQDLTTSIKKIHGARRGNYVPFTIDFIRVKSYEGTESSGKVHIHGCDMSKLRGKHVIFVEDIIDTGLTMTKVLEYMQQTIIPASVRIASLIEKRTTRGSGFKADYVGFSVPDSFIVGYCMDYEEAYRDLDHICVINDKGKEQFRFYDA